MQKLTNALDITLLLFGLITVSYFISEMSSSKSLNLESCSHLWIMPYFSLSKCNGCYAFAGCCAWSAQSMQRMIILMISVDPCSTWHVLQTFAVFCERLHSIGICDVFGMLFSSESRCSKASCEELYISRWSKCKIQVAHEAAVIWHCVPILTSLFFRIENAIDTWYPMMVCLSLKFWPMYVNESVDCNTLVLTLFRCVTVSHFPHCKLIW